MVQQNKICLNDSSMTEVERAWNTWKNRKVSILDGINYEVMIIEGYSGIYVSYILLMYAGRSMKSVSYTHLDVYKRQQPL